jgi:5-(carboxyamino)imidazole ribonucleotide mutase
MELKKVGIIMGSDSDLPIMMEASNVLTKLNIQHEVTVVSAHRTPHRMMEYATNAHERGIEVIIAGAGGAAHLPVIGVLIKSSNSIDGWDSVLSILQMPGGVPVATVALNGAKNAGILAAQMLSIGDKTIRTQLLNYKEELRLEVMKK